MNNKVYVEVTLMNVDARKYKIYNFKYYRKPIIRANQLRIHVFVLFTIRKVCNIVFLRNTVVFA